MCSAGAAFLEAIYDSDADFVDFRRIFSSVIEEGGGAGWQGVIGCAISRHDEHICKINRGIAGLVTQTGRECVFVRVR